MIFTIVSLDILNSKIPDEVLVMLGYSGEPILKDKVLICSELENGDFAISVNLKAENKECARVRLTSEGIELAKKMYGEDSLLTVAEYFGLNFKKIE